MNTCYPSWSQVEAWPFPDDVLRGEHQRSCNFIGEPRILLLKSFYKLSLDSRNGGANQATPVQHMSVLSADTSAYGNVAQRNNEF